MAKILSLPAVNSPVAGTYYLVRNGEVSTDINISGAPTSKVGNELKLDISASNQFAILTPAINIGNFSKLVLVGRTVDANCPVRLDVGIDGGNYTSYAGTGTTNPVTVNAPLSGAQITTLQITTANNRANVYVSELYLEE